MRGALAPGQIAHVAEERADALVLRVLDGQGAHPLELARDLGARVGGQRQRAELLAQVLRSGSRSTARRRRGSAGASPGGAPSRRGSPGPACAVRWRRVPRAAAAVAARRAAAARRVAAAALVAARLGARPSRGARGSGSGMPSRMSTVVPCSSSTGSPLPIHCRANSSSSRSPGSAIAAIARAAITRSSPVRLRVTSTRYGLAWRKRA